MPNYIYALLCPHGEIRYIGKTNNPAVRLSKHISAARSGETTHHTAAWIRSLLSRGEAPAIETVLEVPDGEPWQPYEIRMIAEFKAEGHRLTNSTSGGDGLAGIDVEALQKRTAAARITRATPEYKERISRIMRDVRSTPEFRAAASARIKQTWQDEDIRSRYMAGMHAPEARERRGSATRKRFEDPEQRALHAERSRKAFNDSPEAFAAFQAASQSDTAKANRRASLAKVRETPEYKAKNLAALAEIKDRPEVKAKKSAAARANFSGGALEKCVQSEEFKADQAERLKGRWKDPEAKAKMHGARWTEEQRAAQAAALEARRGKMAAAMTPEVRARQGAKMKEYWARKRAEKAAKLAATTPAPYTEST
jgi:hypothetical protein